MNWSAICGIGEPPPDGMTALIICLAAWRRAKGALMCQPSACDIALEHVIWLRHDDPHITPAEAGATIGAATLTWAEVVQAYAAAWEAIRHE
jgi:hypothetical protein